MFGFLKAFKADMSYWSVYLTINDVNEYALHGDLLGAILYKVVSDKPFKSRCFVSIRYNGSAGAGQSVDLYQAAKRVCEDHGINFDYHKNGISNDIATLVHSMVSAQFNSSGGSSESSIYLEDFKKGTITKLTPFRLGVQRSQSEQREIDNQEKILRDIRKAMTV